MRKPVAGQCGKCGRPVTQPDDLSKLQRFDDVWIDGHHYELGELVEVRCFQHERERQPGGDDDLRVDEVVVRRTCE